MKAFLFLFAAFAAWSSSCTDPGAATSTQPGETIDTLLITAIDRYTQDTVNKNPNLASKQVFPNFFTENDRAVGGYENDQLVTAMLSAFPEDKEVRDLFFLKDGKLVYFKHREWRKQNNPGAVELTCYLDNEKVFYALERSVQLPPGEQPHSLLFQPLAQSLMNKDSLTQAVKADWERVKKALEPSEGKTDGQ